MKKRKYHQYSNEEKDNRLGSYKLSNDIIRRMLPATIENIHGQIVKNISNSEIVLLCTTSMICDASGLVEMTSVSYLCSLTGLSDKTCRNAIAGLRDKGYISICSSGYGHISYSIVNNKFSTERDDLKKYLKMDKTIFILGTHENRIFIKMSRNEKVLLLYLMANYNPGDTISLKSISELMQIKQGDFIRCYLSDIATYFGLQFYTEEKKHRKYVIDSSKRTDYIFRIVKKISDKIPTIDYSKAPSFAKALFHHVTARNKIAFASIYKTITTLPKEIYYLNIIALMIQDYKHCGITNVIKFVIGELTMYSTIGQGEIHSLRIALRSKFA